MGRPKKIVEEKHEDVLEPKKRGRKKKVEEQNTMIEEIIEVNEEEFKIEEEVKEITTQIEDLTLEEEEARDEKRIEKLYRRLQISNQEKKEEEEKVYYLYIYPFSVKGNTPEDSFYKKYMKSFYQVFFYKRHQSICYMDENERKDIEYEDEWEMIKNKQRCIVRKMKNPPNQEEYIRDEWIQWFFEYRKTEDIQNEKDIYQKILYREEYLIETKEKKERMCIDNSFLLNRILYRRIGDIVEPSEWRVRDIFEKMIE